MKDKQIGVRVTQEEYKLIHRAMLDMTIEDNKRVSMSTLLLRLVKKYVNGSDPTLRCKGDLVKKEKQIDSKEDEQESEQDNEPGAFDGLNLDF